MALHQITHRARQIITQSSHAIALAFGADELGAEHILYALLVDHPIECGCASVRLGTSYAAIMTAATRRLGAPAPTKTKEDTNVLLPARHDLHVLEDAFWLAECRGTGFCGLGDLFFVTLLGTDPSLGGGKVKDLIGRDRAATLWALAWDFHEPPFGRNDRDTK